MINLVLMLLVPSLPQLLHSVSIGSSSWMKVVLLHTLSLYLSLCLARDLFQILSLFHCKTVLEQIQPQLEVTD